MTFDTFQYSIQLSKWSWSLLGNIYFLHIYLNIYSLFKVTLFTTNKILYRTSRYQTWWPTIGGSWLVEPSGLAPPLAWPRSYPTTWWRTVCSASNSPANGFSVLGLTWPPIWPWNEFLVQYTISVSFFFIIKCLRFIVGQVISRLMTAKFFLNYYNIIYLIILTIHFTYLYMLYTTVIALDIGYYLESENFLAVQNSR